jgi:hypothetical protein
VVTRGRRKQGSGVSWGGCVLHLAVPLSLLPGAMMSPALPTGWTTPLKPCSKVNP